MKVRCNRLFPGRVFLARLVERVAFFGIKAGTLVLEIDADGAPVQLEPPCAVEVVEATLQEWANLQAAGYELHGALPAADTTDADAYYDRGCAYLAAGALDEAVESFDRALALNDRDAQALFNRGYTRALQLQRLASVAVEAVDGTRRTWREAGAEVLLDRAVADFTHALAIQPGMAKSHGMRAEMYWLRGQQDLAMADYRQAAHLGCEISARRLRERAGGDG